MIKSLGRKSNVIEGIITNVTLAVDIESLT